MGDAGGGSESVRREAPSWRRTAEENRFSHYVCMHMPYIQYGVPRGEWEGRSPAAVIEVQRASLHDALKRRSVEQCSQ